MVFGFQIFWDFWHKTIFLVFALAQPFIRPYIFQSHFLRICFEFFFTRFLDCFLFNRSNNHSFSYFILLSFSLFHVFCYILFSLLICIKLCIVVSLPVLFIFHFHLLVNITYYICHAPFFCQFPFPCVPISFPMILLLSSSCLFYFYFYFYFKCFGTIPYLTETEVAIVTGQQFVAILISLMHFHVGLVDFSESVRFVKVSFFIPSWRKEPFSFLLQREFLNPLYIFSVSHFRLPHLHRVVYVIFDSTAFQSLYILFSRFFSHSIWLIEFYHNILWVLLWVHSILYFIPFSFLTNIFPFHHLFFFSSKPLFYTSFVVDSSATPGRLDARSVLTPHHYICSTFMSAPPTIPESAC